MVVRAVLVGLEVCVLGGALGCGPTAPVGGESSSTEDGTTAAMSTTTSTGTSAPSPTSGTTAGPSTTTEGADVGSDGLPPDVGLECEVDWATMGCGTPSPRGGVTAATPQGDFETTVAVFGGLSGCAGWCPGALAPNVQRIVLAADPAVLEDLEPFGQVDETLVLELDSFQGPLGDPVPATLWASRDGVSTFSGAAEVVIDLLPTAEEVSEPFDPSQAVVVTGSVALEARGWSVQGTFAASYCPEINEYYICE